MKLECPSCGAEVGPEDAVCGSCGTRLRGRRGVPSPWGTPGARRVAASAGLLVALVLAAALAWFVLRDVRPDPEPAAPVPVSTPDR